VSQKIWASEVAKLLGGSLHGIDIVLEGVSSLETPRAASVAFINDVDAQWSAEMDIQRAYFVNTVPRDTRRATFVVVDNPRLAFARYTELIVEKTNLIGIHPTALIDGSSIVHPSVSIGPYAIVEAGCHLAEDVLVESHVVVRSGTEIGKGSWIRSHSVLGGPGFGFETDENGVAIRIHHFGRVIIGTNVEIGSNTVIARGTIDSTIIGDNVKIDDHVFIAHNVSIGARSMIIAGTEISGSVEIGEDCWIAPQVTILNGVKMGNRSFVGLGSVVIRDVPDNVVAVGNPARVIRHR